MRVGNEKAAGVQAPTTPPAAQSGSRFSSDPSLINERMSSMTSHPKHSYSLRVQILNDGQPEDLPINLQGRLAWMLQQLIDAGRAGVTTLERPAPRVGHYLYCLRKKGFAISTTYETHAGAFSGVHGRYRLESEIKVLEDNTRAAV